MPAPIKLVGLFAGIGGIESGFRAALGDRVQTELLCESWDPAQRVLVARFPMSRCTLTFGSCGICLRVWTSWPLVSHAPTSRRPAEPRASPGASRAW